VRLGIESVALDDALGRVLAETLTAGAPLPAFDYSAMDGYALNTDHLTPEGPWSLPLSGESRTGYPPPELERGTACRIFTGAELPAGADSVVIQEDVSRAGDLVRFSERPAKSQHVRRAGEDLRAGDVALEEGTLLGPRQLALAAALDRAALRVAQRPRVTILCTGDELRAPGSPARPASIPDSNGVAISALVRAAGGVPRIAPRAKDDPAEQTACIRDALHDSELLITVGGVSVGEHDVTRKALERAGAVLDFWKVRIKPGKPLVFGRADRTLVLGLPGNPTSAQVTFLLFGAPLLRALQGDRQPFQRLFRARLGAPLRQRPGRRGFYGVRFVEPGVVVPFENQASGAPTTIAWAEALAIVPEDSAGFAEGESVDLMLLCAT
jgi:molybdopterin molybdotransferase